MQNRFYAQTVMHHLKNNLPMKEYFELIERSKKLYQEELKRHNDASHPLNILLFLVDNGITKTNGLSDLYKAIIKNMHDDAFTIVLNIGENYGGTGKPIKSWMSCDLPLLTYITIKINNNKIEEIHKKSITKIVNLVDEGKWKCKSCTNLGNFRGPGRKSDECPITTLNVLKLLTLTTNNEYEMEKQNAIRILLNLWNERKIRKPYLFGMGTDFLKIKYPLIWYDILNLLSVLSQYPEAIQTKEYKEMLNILKENVSKNGFKPQSVYQFWKNFDFGQKKINSKYIEKVYQEIELKSK